MEEVLGAYRRHFWLFFRITAPAVIVSTAALITARNEAREITRRLPRGWELLAHGTEIFGIFLVNLSGWLVSWIAFSVAFAAICIAMEEIASGLTPSARHSLLNVRERSGDFLRLTLLLFGLLVGLEAASIFYRIKHRRVLGIRAMGGAPLARSGLAGFLWTSDLGAFVFVTLCPVGAGRGFG